MARGNYAKELDVAINKADSFLSGTTSASPIMRFIASAESDYGDYNPETALSYGPFQIDPIRYYDIAQNPERANKQRIDKVNEYMRKEMGNPDFDITGLASYNPETQDYDSVDKEMMRDPLVGAMLTRMALMQDTADLPAENELASYYEGFWRPKWSQSEDKEFKDMKRQQAIDKYNKYSTISDVVAEQGSEAF